MFLSFNVRYPVFVKGFNVLEFTGVDCCLNVSCLYVLCDQGSIVGWTWRGSTLMKRSRGRSTWVWSFWKTQRRYGCDVKSLKPGSMTLICPMLKLSWLAHVSCWFGSSEVLNLVISHISVEEFMSWALAVSPPGLCWHLIIITSQAFTLPSWVMLPLSHHSLSHLCVPGYSLSLSQGTNEHVNQDSAMCLSNILWWKWICLKEWGQVKLLLFLCYTRLIEFCYILLYTQLY